MFVLLIGWPGVQDLQHIIDVEGEHSQDVIVDDGGHTVPQQLQSFGILFEKALKPGGIYIIEDVETSYWSDAPQTSFIDHMKMLVDAVNRKYVSSFQDLPVQSVYFGQNCVIIVKSDEVSSGREHYRYHWKVKQWNQNATLPANAGIVDKMSRLQTILSTRHHNDDATSTDRSSLSDHSTAVDCKSRVTACRSNLDCVGAFDTSPTSREYLSPLSSRQLVEQLCTQCAVDMSAIRKSAKLCMQMWKHIAKTKYKAKFTYK